MISHSEKVTLPQIHADMNTLVPMLTGQLRQESHIDYSDGTIVYNTPYAAQQYYGQFENYSTPGTGPEWDVEAAEIFGKSWSKVAQKALR